MNSARVAELVSIRNFLELKANSYHQLGKDVESKMRLAIIKLDKEILDDCFAYLEEKKAVTFEDMLNRKQFEASQRLLTKEEEQALNKKPSEEDVLKLKQELINAFNGDTKTKSKTTKKEVAKSKSPSNKTEQKEEVKDK